MIKKLVFIVIGMILSLAAIWVLSLGLLFTLSKVLLAVGVTLLFDAWTAFYLAFLLILVVTAIRLFKKI